MKPIMENLSEKAKRGRPRTSQRKFAETALLVEGSPRTKSNAGFAFALFAAVANAAEETQRQVWRCTKAEITSGTADVPRGWKSAAGEAGRYLAASSADAEEVVQAIADARCRGVSFADIAAHFRRQRLGERQGSTVALANLLRRKLDDYRKSFPKFTDSQAKAALLKVWNAFKNGEATL